MMKAFVVVFWMLFGKRLDSSPEARPWKLVSVGCTQIGYPSGFLTFHHCGDSGFYLNSCKYEKKYLEFQSSVVHV
jgi:hypothetical protein